MMEELLNEVVRLLGSLHYTADLDAEDGKGTMSLQSDVSGKDLPVFLDYDQKDDTAYVFFWDQAKDPLLIQVLDEMPLSSVTSEEMARRYVNRCLPFMRV